MKHFLLIILSAITLVTETFAISTKSGNEDEIQWGQNLTNDINKLTLYSYFGINKLSCAVFVPGDKILKGGKITAASVPIYDNNTRNVKMWVKKTLDDDAILASESITDIKDRTWNRADFNETIDIPTEGLYVGYTYESNDLYFYQNNETNDTFWTKPGEYNWIKNDYGTIPIHVFVTGIEEKENNVCISLPVSSTIKNISTENSITVKFTNYAKNEVNSLKVSVDNGEDKRSHSINLGNNKLIAGYGSTVELDISYIAPSTYSAKNKVTFTIDEVNGQPNNSDMNVAVLNIMTPKEGMERNVLVEENTGTGCGYCVYGYVDMEVMKERLGDRFIGIALHQFNSDDPMFLTSDSYANLDYSGAPQCIVNRKDRIHPREMYDCIDEYLETPSLVNLNASAEWNADGTTITISTDIEPLLNDLDFEIAYVLTADGLTKMSRSWAQNNYLANDEPSPLFSGDPIVEFCVGGKYATNPVLGLTFNDVAISTSYKKSQTEIAPYTGVVVGEIYHNDYTLQLNTSAELKELIDKGKTHIVVIVNTKDGSNANALKIPVKACSTGISQTEDVNTVVTTTYTIDGRETNVTTNGIRILKMSDGNTKKVMTK